MIKEITKEINLTSHEKEVFYIQLKSLLNRPFYMSMIGKIIIVGMAVKKCLLIHILRRLSSGFCRKNEYKLTF